MRLTCTARCDSPIANRMTSLRYSHYTYLGAVIVCVLALVPYLNILANGFALDSVVLVERSVAIQRADWFFLLTSDYWATYDGRSSSLYRPLTSVCFAIQHAIGAGAPSFFHGTSLLLHGVVSLGTWFLLRRLANLPAAFIGAALFAVHPVHTEVVASIVGQADLWAALFVILGLVCAIDAGQKGRTGWNVVSALCFALALFSKESAIVFLPMLGAVDWYQYRTGNSHCFSPRTYILCVLVLAAYGAIRYEILGGWQVGYIDPLDNALVDLPTLDRVANAAVIAWFYLGLLVLPYKLSADYSYNALSIATLLPGGLSALLLFFAAVVFLLWRYYRAPSLCLLGALWMLVAFVPIANVFFSIGTMAAERLLYLPSLGFCAFVGVATARLWHRADRRLFFAIAVCSVFFLSGRTWVRNGEWRSNETLLGAAVRDYPQSAKAQAGFGEALLKRGDAIGALDALGRAVEIYPSYDDAYFFIGLAYMELHQWDNARAAFAQTESVNALHHRAVVNQGVALWELGRREEAVAAYRRALEIAPGYELALQNLKRAAEASEP